MRHKITLEVSTGAHVGPLLSEVDNELEYFLHTIGCELGEKVCLEKLSIETAENQREERSAFAVRQDEIARSLRTQQA